MRDWFRKLFRVETTRERLRWADGSPRRELTLPRETLVDQIKQLQASGKLTDIRTRARR